MADVPHLAHPFRIADGRAAVVEQGSREEIATNVYAILATQPGDRAERPEFGFPSQVFRQGGVSLTELVDVVEEWEPRARILPEAQMVGLAQTVRVEVQ